MAICAFQGIAVISKRRLSEASILVLGLLACGSLGIDVRAQQVVVETPMFSVNDSFYEYYGMGWGFDRLGPRGSMFFNWGSPTGVFPGFGVIDPSAGARFGFATRTGNGNFRFNMMAGQGSQRSINMVSPSLNLMNGVPGSIQSGTFRPFVTGLIPVVGSGFAPSWPTVPGPVLINPLTQKIERLRQLASAPEGTSAENPDELLLDGSLGGAPDNQTVSPRTNSSAQNGDVSIAEIKQQQARDDQANVDAMNQLLAQGQEAEAAGKSSIARVRYAQAAQLANGEKRREILARVQRLQAK